MANWLKLLHKNLKADILVNGYRTDKIDIEQSVKQGYTLSCLLFILCMDPLIIKVNRASGILIPTVILIFFQRAKALLPSASHHNLRRHSFSRRHHLTVYCKSLWTSAKPDKPGKRISGDSSVRFRTLFRPSTTSSCQKHSGLSRHLSPALNAEAMSSGMDKCHENH